MVLASVGPLEVGVAGLAEEEMAEAIMTRIMVEEADDLGDIDNKEEAEAEAAAVVAMKLDTTMSM